MLKSRLQISALTALIHAFTERAVITAQSVLEFTQVDRSRMAQYRVVEMNCKYLPSITSGSPKMA